LLSLADAEAQIGGALTPLRTIALQSAASCVPPPVGVTPYVFLRQDRRRAYPVVQDIPVLLIPEMLGIDGDQRAFDLRDGRYAESYAEMTVYNQVAIQGSENIEQSEAYQIIAPLLAAPHEQLKSFPQPPTTWLDAVYDCASQWDAYSHVAPIRGKRVLQLGGKGTHAVKFLLAGARETWVLSPMIGELVYCKQLGLVAGVSDRLKSVAGIAEELPFPDGFFDAIYSGGCFHHTETALALPEISRVLRDGGTFCAVDPWRTPVYGLGKAMFGQREVAHCHPLTNRRLEELPGAFRRFQIVNHGALVRYPLLVLNKLGLTISMKTGWRASRIEDFCSDLLPGFRSLMGGSVALLCTK
jgi:Methyltransferase domain